MMSYSINKSGNINFRHIHQVNLDTVKLMYNTNQLIFVLSTGRTGTKFLWTLFDKSKNTQAYHEAFPGLQFFVNYAYQNQNKKKILIKMIDCARM
ncbi:MAG: hypothetical protein K8S00_11915, partial [Bacteroidales bacterium]|nr:hypothetical protein [Bacteroidales bacterium]